MTEEQLKKLHKHISGKLRNGDIGGIMKMLDPEKVGDMKALEKTLKGFSDLKPTDV